MALHVYFEWPKLSGEEQSTLLTHLKVLCARDGSLRFLNEVCVFMLDKYDGELNEENFNFAKLVQSFDKSLADTNKVIGEHHKELTAPLNTAEAAEYLGISDSYVRKLARAEIIDGKKEDGRWIINGKASLNEWLIDTGRVKID